ncbi:spectrin beta chain-like [Pecten maximus]|uniref:spectrin beta chain-like n=1 Tax=Pecten maximus TaxID=6579 RepID=UPI001458F54A|nr:spectrin beta chain-like [Pecten maximus]
MSSETVHHEGLLTRKHEWVNDEEKATNRSWDKVYVVLHGNTLSCYKDKKKQDRIHHEPVLSLASAACRKATDYTKRPNVFRVKLATGGEYLFHAKHEAEMETWISQIVLATGTEPASASGSSQTMPATMEGSVEK